MHDWIISDTHFNHSNIVRYCNRPVNHNWLMQQNWRRIVGPEDTVLHLGDVLMGSSSVWAKSPGWLPGKVTVLSGNHDSKAKVDFMTSTWGWRFRPDFTINYRGRYITFSHYPVENLADGTLNVHGHIHNRPSRSSRHVNVCVEVMDYKPVHLQSFLDQQLSRLF